MYERKSVNGFDSYIRLNGIFDYLVLGMREGTVQ